MYPIVFLVSLASKPNSVVSEDDAFDIFLLHIKPVESDNWYLKLRENVVENPESYPQFKVDNNFLFKYILSKTQHQTNEKERKSQRQDIIKDLHNPLFTFWFFFKTLRRVQEHYYFVFKAQKMSNTVPMGIMAAEKSVEFPFQIIAVDIMGPFPRSPRGFNYLLVVGDWFSKYTDVH